MATQTQKVTTEKQTTEVSKWLFIIRPSRMDFGAIIHHAIWVDVDATEEEISAEYEAYVREEFPNEPDAWWMITDKGMENFIVGDNQDEDTNIYEHEDWVFVDTGYIARAIYMPTGEAYDIESYETLEEMAAEAEETKKYYEEVELEPLQNNKETTEETPEEKERWKEFYERIRKEIEAEELEEWIKKEMAP